ncbi:UNVERIFIED_CONTAM: hypothetical protein HDU68_011223, partial [Siphonaria sp. JEL0065]
MHTPNLFLLVVILLGQASPSTPSPVKPVKPVEMPCAFLALFGLNVASPRVLVEKHLNGSLAVRPRVSVASDLVNLFSFSVTPCAPDIALNLLALLNSSPDVLSVSPVKSRQRPDLASFPLPPQAPAQSEYDAIHSLTGVNKARSILNATGAGIKVALIDSGVFYSHPALGGCFGKLGCKVGFGWDFVGDKFDGSNEPIGDEDPFEDCSVE